MFWKKKKKKKNLSLSGVIFDEDDSVPSPSAGLTGHVEREFQNAFVPTVDLEEASGFLMGELRKPRKVFGHMPKKVHKFLPLLFQYLEEIVGLNKPGIFTKQCLKESDLSDGSVVDEIIEIFDEEPDLDNEYDDLDFEGIEELSESQSFPVCVVISEYYNTFPEPLMSEGVISELVAYDKEEMDPKNAISKIKELIDEHKVSDVHRELMKLLFRTLNKVLEKQKMNCVKEEDLAEAYCRGILGVENFSQENKKLLPLFLIIMKNYEKIFV